MSCEGANQLGHFYPPPPPSSPGPFSLREVRNQVHAQLRRKMLAEEGERAHKPLLQQPVLRQSPPGARNGID